MFFLDLTSDFFQNPSACVVCFVSPCFGTADCSWAVDAVSLRILTLPYWIFFWSSTRLFITRTQIQTQTYINTIMNWFMPTTQPSENQRIHCNVNRNTCYTDRQSTQENKGWKFWNGVTWTTVWRISFKMYRKWSTVFCWLSFDIFLF